MGAVHEILMPRLSDTMVEGLIVRWMRHEGDEVARGDELVEIETDKVTTVVTAETDGTLLAVRFAEQTSAPTGAVIAVIGSAVDAAAASESGPAMVEEPTQQATPGDRSASDAVVPAAPHLETASARRRASPLARKMASELGLQLAVLPHGSGPGGRILGHDVIRAGREGGSDPSPSEDIVRELSPIEAVIARRMTAAKDQIPHFYLQTEVDVTRAEQLRLELREDHSDAPLSMTDLVVRACALALRDVPEVNAAWDAGAIVVRGAVNIGLAVALDGNALIVPVLRDVDNKSLFEIAQMRQRLVQSARANGLRADDVAGGTFTVSSLGMFGVDQFFAIVNPPESGILAVGAIVRRPRFSEGTLIEAKVMNLSLSADHRVYSGATGARFLAGVRAYIERPHRLVVDQARVDNGSS